MDKNLEALKEPQRKTLVISWYLLWVYTKRYTQVKYGPDGTCTRIF